MGQGIGQRGLQLYLLHFSFLKQGGSKYDKMILKVVMGMSVQVVLCTFSYIS